MNFINYIKTHKKSVEKVLVITGATLLVLSGLFWNLYSDLALKAKSQQLFIGLLTSIVGGVLVYIGNSVNNFDVKIPGLVSIGCGIVLGIGNIVYLLVEGLPGLSIISFIFVLIAIISTSCGLALQITRLIKNEE